jgi:hypothetical protein
LRWSRFVAGCVGVAEAKRPTQNVVQAAELSDIDQLGKVVSLARIDGRKVRPFSFSRVILVKFAFISRE